MLPSGTRLGPYEILGLIGEGGMGQVYRAADTRLDRAVAIKVMPAALADDPARRERFEREARNISKLEHPNICPLYDVGELPAGVGGGLFLVMQFLEGETLAQRISRGALSIKETLEKRCAEIGRDSSEIDCSVNVRYNPELGPSAAADAAAAFKEAGADIAIVYLPEPHTPNVLEPIADALRPLS